jgi:hypothetical protein
MSEAAKKLDDATSPLTGLALYDDLLIPVCAVDSAGVVCYFNSTFTSFIKLSPRKIRGKPLKEVINSKVITSTDLVERCHKEWLPTVSEETTIDVGGEEVRDAIFKLIPHTSPDGSRQIVLTVQDVSIERILHAKHRVQLDELKAKNDEIKNENAVYVPAQDMFWGISDQLAFGNYRVMNIYCQCVLNIHIICSMGYIYHPESLLYNHCNFKNLYVKNFDAFYHVL